MPAASSTSHRQAIVVYLGKIEGFTTARAISDALGLPYKSVIDALNALHGAGRVARRGRKFRATWASLWHQQSQADENGWRSLAAAWFGR